MTKSPFSSLLPACPCLRPGTLPIFSRRQGCPGQTSHLPEVLWAAGGRSCPSKPGSPVGRPGWRAPPQVWGAQGRRTSPQERKLLAVVVITDWHRNRAPLQGGGGWSELPGCGSLGETSNLGV